MEMIELTHYVKSGVFDFEYKRRTTIDSCPTPLGDR